MILLQIIVFLLLAASLLLAFGIGTRAIGKRRELATALALCAALLAMLNVAGQEATPPQKAAPFKKPPPAPLVVQNANPKDVSRHANDASGQPVTDTPQAETTSELPSKPDHDEAQAECCLPRLGLLNFPVSHLFPFDWSEKNKIFVVIGSLVRMGRLESANGICATVLADHSILNGALQRNAAAHLLCGQVKGLAGELDDAHSLYSEAVNLYERDGSDPLRLARAKLLLAATTGSVDFDESTALSWSRDFKKLGNDYAVDAILALIVSARIGRNAGNSGLKPRFNEIGNAIEKLMPNDQTSARSLKDLWKALDKG